MKNVYLLTIFVSLFCSCGNQKQQFTGDMQTIKFKQVDNVPPSDVFETVFIKLETNEKCLIDKTIRQIESASDKLFVLSGGAENSLLVYELSGKFVTQIGARGNGPGEYIVPISFSIDRQKNLVSIIDLAQKKILRYDLNNYTLISEKIIKMDNSYFEYLSCFEYADNGKIIWNNVDSHSGWEFLITDMEYNVLDKVVEKNFKTGYFTGRDKRMYKKDSTIFAYTHYDSKIYGFRDSKIVSVYNLMFDGFQFLPLDYLKKISADNANFLHEMITSEYISKYSVFETGKTMCVYYSVSEESYVGIYNRETEQANSYAVTVFQDFLKIGNIDGILGATDEYIIALLQPFELLEKQTQGYQFPSDLQSLLEKSHEDDNPILCLFRLK
jgi:hypothetical protein